MGLPCGGSIEHVPGEALSHNLNLWGLLHWINLWLNPSSDVFRHYFQHQSFVFRFYNKQFFVRHPVLQDWWCLVNICQSVINLVSPLCLRCFVNWLHIPASLDNRWSMICINLKVALCFKKRSCKRLSWNLSWGDVFLWELRILGSDWLAHIFLFYRCIQSYITKQYLSEINILVIDCFDDFII